MQEFNSSFGEVRAGLAEVAARLRDAYQHARTAELQLTEATELLTELDRAHHDQLVPRELLGANAELTRVLELIMGGADSVASIEARL